MVDTQHLLKWSEMIFLILMTTEASWVIYEID